MKGVTKLTVIAPIVVDVPPDAGTIVWNDFSERRGGPGGNETRHAKRDRPTTRETHEKLVRLMLFFYMIT